MAYTCTLPDSLYGICGGRCACMSYEEEEEDTCMSYEDEDTCMYVVPLLRQYTYVYVSRPCTYASVWEGGVRLGCNSLRACSSGKSRDTSNLVPMLYQCICVCYTVSAYFSHPISSVSAGPDFY